VGLLHTALAAVVAQIVGKCLQLHSTQRQHQNQSVGFLYVVAAKYV